MPRAAHPLCSGHALARGHASATVFDASGQRIDLAPRSERSGLGRLIDPALTVQGRPATTSRCTTLLPLLPRSQCS